MTRPEYRCVWVLSDLHLAPDSDLLEFRAHEALAALLRHMAARGERALLVLNGDVLDYLQLPGYEDLSLVHAERRTRAMLEALAGEPAARNVVSALREWLARGHGLRVVPGNHDPELALAGPQRALREVLGEGIEFHLDDGPWEACAGGRRVLGVHGHLSDPWNAIPMSRLLEAQARGDATATMPPGSRLVRDVINPYRRALQPDGTRRFPFVDLVKPDGAAVLLLLYLDPGLALRRLRRAIGLSAQSLVRDIGRLLDGDPRLGEQAESGQDATPAGELAGDLVAVMDARERAGKRALLDALRADLTGTARSVDGTLGGAGGVARSLLLRALARKLQAEPDFHDPAALDDLAREGPRHIPPDPGSVLLTGHTHAPRHMRYAHDRHYLNTGTWQDLVRAPPALSPAELEAWIAALTRDEVPRVRRLTVARIDADSAGLLEWEPRGRTLDPVGGTGAEE